MANILKYLKIPLFTKKELLLSFEYGMILSESAKGKGVELTREVVERGEEIILKEFAKNNLQQLALDMPANILAMFQPDSEV